MLEKLLKSKWIIVKGVRSMNLNRDKLIAEINSKWQTKTCPMCGQNDWDIGSSMATLVNVGEDKSIQLGGQFMPLVPIVCNSCGNVILVNPLTVGALDNL